ncbi:hypothetical protein [Paraflavitalea sp. CAU 1676]|uniref:phosphotriesterase family protein n=1 Tax=Paraflavitalea sp. CAU 1676 TaxID=3032598 RepID=UPI0023DA06CC|nr:hypothetical protein [Paraflavitalea sp. CAU 1676]MDF2191847.1 hypothetical protein [Paraflavitalea sp. CAU 1676]
MGATLIHEHILVDFIGADKISYDRWNREEVIKKVMPYLEEMKAQGVKTFFDCTPAFLGRDPVLLKTIAEKTGLHIVTNTGYYGAIKNKHLPAWAHTETDQQLALRWIREAKEGIEGTDVRPGFIKISVDEGKLSALHQKIVRAAAITHLATGLTICSHTGKAPAAFEQLEILKAAGLQPDTFVWVHAQAEDNIEQHIKAATMGAWVSLDAIGWGKPEQYVSLLTELKERRLLHRVLISHDAGWYDPAKPAGGEFIGFTALFTKLIPLLKSKDFTKADIDQLLVYNPIIAFTAGVRRLP